MEDQNRLKFTWEVTDFEEKSIEIEIEFEQRVKISDSISRDRVQIGMNQSPYIVSMNNDMVDIESLKKTKSGWGLKAVPRT